MRSKDSLLDFLICRVPSRNCHLSVLTCSTKGDMVTRLSLAKALEFACLLIRYLPLVQADELVPEFKRFVHGGTS